MVSVIICSRSTHALKTVSDNVSATIGVPFEIIAIDNSSNEYGICRAYNEGAVRAQFECLCFMHEDLCFQAANWGNTIVSILSDASVGVLGVAGGTYQVCAPASWNSFGTEFIIMNVVQGRADGGKELMRSVPGTEAAFRVAAVDGLWMCCRKAVWNEFKFDEAAFPEFHFYDIDFCTRVFPKYDVVVTPDILVEHFSQGSYNASWYRNALKFYRMRNKYLPFGSAKLTLSKERKVRLQALQAFIAGYIDHDITPAQMMSLLAECFAIEPFNRDTMWLVKKYFKVKVINGAV